MIEQDRVQSLGFDHGFHRGQQKMRVFTLGPHTHVMKQRAGHFLQVYRKLATSITFIARASVVELVSIRTEVAASSPLRWRIVGKRPERAWTFSSRALSGEAPRVLSSQLSDGETDGDLGDHVKRTRWNDEAR